MGMRFSAIAVKLHRGLGGRGGFFQNFVLKKAVLRGAHANLLQKQKNMPLIYFCRTATNLAAG